MSNTIGGIAWLASFAGVAFLTMDLYIPMAACFAIMAGAILLERRANG